MARATETKVKYTRSPCPGCGEPPQFRRKADTLCEFCLALMEDGRRYRAEIDRAGKKQFLTAPERGSSYNLRFIHRASGHSMEEDYGRQFQDVFLKLIYATAREVHGEAVPDRLYDKNGCDKSTRLPGDYSNFHRYVLACP